MGPKTGLPATESTEELVLEFPSLADLIAPAESSSESPLDGAAEESTLLHIPESIVQPIPEDLHSAYEEGPFKKCTVCQNALSEAGLYEIQKVYRGTEVIFETAICHSCGEDLVRELSEESLKTMKGYLLCNFQPSDEAGHCHFCGFARGIVSSYTCVGACHGSSLLLPQIIMCEKCSESLNENLSQKTRDIQADFVQDNFPGVPADLDLSPSLGGLF